MDKYSIIDFLVKYLWRTLGVLLAFLLVFLGFWQLLYLLILIVSFYFIGSMLDNNPNIKQTIQNQIDKWFRR